MIWVEGNEKDNLNHMNEKQENIVPVALMVGLGKIFDSVWIDGLLLEMHYPGIRSNVWSLIKNFPSEWKLPICIDGLKTEKIIPTVGLPKGLVLSPSLKVSVHDMCCNHIPKNYNYAKVLMILTSEKKLNFCPPKIFNFFRTFVK